MRATNPRRPWPKHGRLPFADGVARVTLAVRTCATRSTPTSSRELHDAFERIAAADDVRAVVLAGEGKVFCGGADINWMRDSLDLSFEANVIDAERMSDMFRAIDNCPRSRSSRGFTARRSAAAPAWPPSATSSSRPTTRSSVSPK